MSRSAVLVITNEQDVGGDFLVRELDQRGVSIVRLNTERGPKWQLSLRPTGQWRVARGERVMHSEECAGVWWRRPEVPAVSGVGAADEAIGDQWRAFVSALATTQGPIWVSEPACIRVAEGKALQLRRASESGLAVPDSLWTNDADEARAFVAGCGGTAVVKSVASAWWEEDGEGRFVFASLVGVDDLPAPPRLSSSPICLQQPVLPKRDIRVTVIKDAAFAAMRDNDPAQADEPVDWRRAPQRAWSQYHLPPEVAARCCAVVASYGLRFGAIDLALDNEGTHWFLELNPNGEWGWLQRAGLPIAKALADALLATPR